jgi:hypothetical protein
MCDWFEHITCNSELEWTSSDITGDLTSAPMIGIYGEEQPLDEKYKKWDFLQGTRFSSCCDGKTFVEPVLERWAFMDYAVRSVLEDLRDYGKAVFIGGQYA